MPRPTPALPPRPSNKPRQAIGRRAFAGRQLRHPRRSRARRAIPHLLGGATRALSRPIPLTSRVCLRRRCLRRLKRRFRVPPPPPPGDWSTRGLPNGASIHPPRPHLLSSPLPSSLPCSRPPLTVPILTVADAVESRPSQRRSRGAFGATSSRWRLSPPTLRAAHADVRLVGSA